MNRSWSLLRAKMTFLPSRSPPATRCPWVIRCAMTLSTVSRLTSWLFQRDTVDKAIAQLMTHGHRGAGGDRLGKTVIFARNNAHALFIAERFDQTYPQFRGNFAEVITHSVERAEILIDRFSASDSAPPIALSAVMLD